MASSASPSCRRGRGRGGSGDGGVGAAEKERSKTGGEWAYIIDLLALLRRCLLLGGCLASRRLAGSGAWTRM
jgi:hypothetical protein